jgi:hypothetical protein
VIGFYNRDEKCLQRGTNWVFKQSSLRFVFKGSTWLIYANSPSSYQLFRLALNAPTSPNVDSIANQKKQVVFVNRRLINSHIHHQDRNKIQGSHVYRVKQQWHTRVWRHVRLSADGVLTGDENYSQKKNVHSFT